MKILVKSRNEIETKLKSEPNWFSDKYIISIYSNGCKSPFESSFNVLQLCFDDVTENESLGIHFSQNHAMSVMDFIKDIPANSYKLFYVHCDAGISRSGAIGYMLNEYFNKFLKNNKEDNRFFQTNNLHILPNPEVVRVLKKVMFNINYEHLFNEANNNE